MKSRAEKLARVNWNRRDLIQNDRPLPLHTVSANLVERSGDGNERRNEAPSLPRSWMRVLVWCPRNTYTFVALKLAWGEARGRECIPSDTRPTEQRSPRPISAQPGGRHVFWAEALLLAPYRSTAGYARRSRLASAQNPLPRMYSYFGDTTLEFRAQHGRQSVLGQS